jgi:hypothetical protein
MLLVTDVSLSVPRAVGFSVHVNPVAALRRISQMHPWFVQ